MSAIIRLFGAAALLVASASAISITPHDNALVARSPHHHHRDIVPETLANVERAKKPKVCVAWAGNSASNLKHYKTEHSLQ